MMTNGKLYFIVLAKITSATRKKEEAFYAKSTRTVFGCCFGCFDGDW